MATRDVTQRGPARRAPAKGRSSAARGAVIRRRLLAAAVVLLVLYGAYMLWFRNLSLFAVHDVTIRGATTNERQIKSAVEQVAGDMTTLHIKDDELRDAVARFPTVASVGASTSFPHGLEVTITERLPVAFIRVDGQETAVSADGYLLYGADFDAKALPRIEGASAHGVRLDEDAAAQAAILGATPGPLKDSITASTWDDQRGGIVVDLKNGPEVRFGDGSRAQDKWVAAVAVLSGDERGSPSYLDVSVPDRPVSGG
jgi:cell division protein FtsQ